MKFNNSHIKALLDGKEIQLSNIEAFEFSGNTNLDKIHLSLNDFTGLLPRVRPNKIHLLSGTKFRMFLVPMAYSLKKRLVVNTVGAPNILTWADATGKRVEKEWLKSILQENALFSNMNIVNINYNRLWRSLK